MSLLRSAWRAQAPRSPFNRWLENGPKAVLLPGPHFARRLPAYAAEGALSLPIPAFRWARGHRLDQRLFDLQAPVIARLAEHAGSHYALLLAAGDLLLQLPAKLPAFPPTDVLGLGLWQKPGQLKEGGVFACARQNPEQLAFFAHKPREEQLRDWQSDYLCLADAGVWLLSAAAVEALMAVGGKVSARQPFDFFSHFALGLGSQPAMRHPRLARLSCACVPLPEARTYRFGSSRQIITAVSGLQNVELDEVKLGLMGAKRHPDTFLQNARFHYPLKFDLNHTVWVENSVVGKRWRLECEHVITGVPENDWNLRLEKGVCLDVAPVGRQDFCVRCYGLDDRFTGPLDDPKTQWLGAPAREWFARRGLDLVALGLRAGTDIFEAAIFPVLAPAELDPRFIEWLFTAQPAANAEFARRYSRAKRLSARDLLTRTNLPRLHAQRDRLRAECLLPMLRNFRYSVFFKLDLESTARIFAASRLALPKLDAAATNGLEPLQAVHDQMFRAAVLRHRRQPGWEAFEASAFQRLREMIVRDAQLSPALPRRSVQEDQIVWGRSPVRLDLAGGWTDTPPYCLEYGGKVLNVAVNLNGQPPIQVFAKLSARPELVLRSIDLGVEQRVHTYRELDTYATPGSEFALAKAAFALAGFLPRFHARGGYANLRQQLERFGGGIELSLLSAVPKGSGLGTSSILAATILATLSDLCGLGWDKNLLFKRTLALEQMLTTGGGWQDQAGAIFGGLKLIETGPGLKQTPTLRWLPTTLFGRDYANKTILLYYTGITRLAKNILQEIVRGIFLNSPAHLRTIEAIGRNAERACDALQECDYGRLITAIQTSWRLNQELDSGTNPPAIQNILGRIAGHLAAAKLLGAGGGGFLLMLAKDESAATQIRRTLTENPPNPRARFVELSLSETGLQVTRS